MVNEISARTGLKESSSFMQEPMALSSVFLEESNKLRELFKQLSERFPDLRLVDGFEPQYHRNLGFRVPNSVMVETGK